MSISGTTLIVKGFLRTQVKGMGWGQFSLDALEGGVEG